MARRKSWSELTPAYRARLERRGVTAKTHATANLIRARGHRPALPPGSIEPDYIDRLLREPGTYMTREALGGLEDRFTRPSWIPAWVHPDAAAALSQLPNPKRWTNVEFVPRDDGRAWTMTVSLKGNAYDRTILIPGGGGPGSGAKEVLQLVTDLKSQGAARGTTRRSYKDVEALFFEVRGTDDESDAA